MKAKKQRPKAADTMERMIEEAADLFYERGFMNVSIEDICASDRVSLTKGAFYYVFSSKEEILFCIHDRYLNKSMEVINGMKGKKLSPRDKMRTLFNNTKTILSTMREFVVVANREYRYLTGDYRRQAEDLRRNYRRAVEAIIREGQRSGDFDPALNPKIATLNYLGLVNWVYQWYRADGSLSADEIVEQCERQVFSGIEHRP